MSDRTLVVPLEGTGAKTELKIENVKRVDWQIQSVGGLPINRLEGFGERKGDRLVIPPVERGTRYQVVIVYRGEG